MLKELTAAAGSYVPRSASGAGDLCCCSGRPEAPAEQAASVAAPERGRSSASRTAPSSCRCRSGPVRTYCPPARTSKAQISAPAPAPVTVVVVAAGQGEGEGRGQEQERGAPSGRVLSRHPTPPRRGRGAAACPFPAPPSRSSASALRSPRPVRRTPRSKLPRCLQERGYNCPIARLPDPSAPRSRPERPYGSAAGIT